MVVGNKRHCGERLSGFAQTSVKVEEVHPTLFYQVSGGRGRGRVERGEREAFPVGKRRHISLVEGDFFKFLYEFVC